MKKMNRYSFTIVLLVALIFVLAGCAKTPQPYMSLYDNSLKFYSYEQLAQLKKEDAKAGEDSEYNEVNLKGLDYYYVSVYAENNWEFTSGSLYVASSNVFYDLTKPEGQHHRSVFTFWISRNESGKESLAKIIDPKSYRDGIAPELLEGTEGVYCEELYGENNADNPVAQFHWVYDGYYCFMKLSKALMDEIKKNDPEALKGPLFELQKVELK